MKCFFFIIGKQSQLIQYMKFIAKNHKIHKKVKKGAFLAVKDNSNKDQSVVSVPLNLKGCFQAQHHECDQSSTQNQLHSTSCTQSILQSTQTASHQNSPFVNANFEPQNQNFCFCQDSLERFIFLKMYQNQSSSLLKDITQQILQQSRPNNSNVLVYMSRQRTRSQQRELTGVLNLPSQNQIQNAELTGNNLRRAVFNNSPVQNNAVNPQNINPPNQCNLNVPQNLTQIITSNQTNLEDGRQMDLTVSNTYSFNGNQNNLNNNTNYSQLNNFSVSELKKKQPFSMVNYFKKRRLERGQVQDKQTTISRTPIIFGNSYRQPEQQDNNSLNRKTNIFENNNNIPPFLGSSQSNTFTFNMIDNHANWKLNFEQDKGLNLNVSQQQKLQTHSQNPGVNIANLGFTNSTQTNFNNFNCNNGSSFNNQNVVQNGQSLINPHLKSNIILKRPNYADDQQTLMSGHHEICTRPIFAINKNDYDSKVQLSSQSINQGLSQPHSNSTNVPRTFSFSDINQIKQTDTKTNSPKRYNPFILNHKQQDTCNNKQYKCNADKILSTSSENKCNNFQNQSIFNVIYPQVNQSQNNHFQSLYSNTYLNSNYLTNFAPFNQINNLFMFSNEISGRQNILSESRQSQDNIEVVTNQNFQSMTWKNLIKSFKNQLKFIICQIFESHQSVCNLSKSIKPLKDCSFSELQIFNFLKSCQYIPERSSQKLNYIDPNNIQSLNAELDRFNSSQFKDYNKLIKLIQSFVYSSAIMMQESSVKYISLQDYLQKIQSRQAGLYKMITMILQDINQKQTPQVLSYLHNLPWFKPSELVIQESQIQTITFMQNARQLQSKYQNIHEAQRDDAYYYEEKDQNIAKQTENSNIEKQLRNLKRVLSSIEIQVQNMNAQLQIYFSQE